MITEDYVSVETAELLKEKGFDENTNCYYIEGSVDKNLCYSPIRQNHNKRITNNEFDINIDITSSKISAPTLQMTMKWLREVHGITIIPNLRVPDPITGTIDCYCAGVWHVPKNNGGALCFTSPTPYEGYSSYEEACEEAIKYCLEKLI